MAKSFVAGALIGVVVSAVGAGAVSLMIGPPARGPVSDMPLPEAPAPERPAPEVATAPSQPAPVDTAPKPEPEPDPVDAASPPRTPTEPASAAAPDVPSEPDIAAPGSTAGAPAQMADTDSPATPPALPEPVVEPAQDATAAQIDHSAPLIDDADPGIPPAPVPEASAGVPAISAPATADRSASTTAQAEAEPLPDLSTAIPEPPLPAPAELPDSGGRGAQLPTIASAEIEPTTPAPDVAQPDPAPQDTGPSIGAPGTSLIDRDGTVPRRRLPGIGPGDAVTPELAESDITPLQRFAAATDVAPEEPLMSVVLIDDGGSPLGPATVGELPFPVSFAISPSHPDAAATARAYRAAGFEVLALAGAPDGAQASDVEISLEGALGAVPEAIGVLEDPATGLQASRAVSEQAAQFLRDTGHGLLMLPKGLGTGEALAQRIGVPTAQVFRDFDGAGQDPRVMRRFLDQAAFRARQEGSVVMLGRLRADTVSALLLWGLQDRASSVTLVPVSAVLQASGAPG